MRAPPKAWNISGYKLKSTKFVLELYLRIIEDEQPSCCHAAIMSMWDHPELLAQGWGYGSIGTYIHNLRYRIQCAYYAHTSHEIKNIAQEVGMMHRARYIELIQLAIALPKEYCGDHYNANAT